MAKVEWNYNNLEYTIGAYNDNKDSEVIYAEASDRGEFMGISLSDAEFIHEELGKRISEFKQAIGQPEDSRVTKLQDLLTDEEIVALKFAMSYGIQALKNKAIHNIECNHIEMANYILDNVKLGNELVAKFE